MGLVPQTGLASSEDPLSSSGISPKASRVFPALFHLSPLQGLWSSTTKPFGVTFPSFWGHGALRVAGWGSVFQHLLREEAENVCQLQLPTPASLPVLAEHWSAACTAGQTAIHTQNTRLSWSWRLVPLRLIFTFNYWRWSRVLCTVSSSSDATPPSGLWGHLHPYASIHMYIPQNLKI